MCGSYSLSTSGGSCQQCIPPNPSNLNALPITTINGANTYTWTCALGYYGAQLSRTCGTTGTWSPSNQIACTACVTQTANANTAVTNPTAGTVVYVSVVATQRNLRRCDYHNHVSCRPVTLDTLVASSRRCVTIPSRVKRGRHPLPPAPPVARVQAPTEATTAPVVISSCSARLVRVP